MAPVVVGELVLVVDDLVVVGVDVVDVLVVDVLDVAPPDPHVKTLGPGIVYELSV